MIYYFVEALWLYLPYYDGPVDVPEGGDGFSIIFGLGLPFVLLDIGKRAQ